MTTGAGDPERRVETADLGLLVFGGSLHTRGWRTPWRSHVYEADLKPSARSRTNGRGYFSVAGSHQAMDG